jgi:hypothetical protein
MADRMYPPWSRCFYSQIDKEIEKLYSDINENKQKIKI